MQCPVPIIKTDNEVISGSTISADIEIIDGIILTQACDIANRKIDNIIKKREEITALSPLPGASLAGLCQIFHESRVARKY